MLYLGIDGGGSKTAFLLVDEHDNEICRVQSGPSNYLSVGPEAAKAAIAQGISELPQPPDIVCGGFAGAGRPEGKTFFKELLHSLIPEAQVIVESDAFIAYIGAIGIDPGILLIAGTGSIVIGRDKNRSIFRVGGWGPYFGDEGSGFWIGREAIRAALRAIDSEEGDEFTKRIAAKLGLSSISEIAGAWAAGKAGVPEVAGLFPEVIAMYPRQPVRQIIADAALQLHSLVDIALKKVDSEQCRRTISGSVATHPIMRDLIGLEFEIPQHSPEWGAVLWARRHHLGLLE